VTAGTRDYPDIVGGKYANQPELDQDMQTVRQTAALERIATALEQLVLAQVPSELAAFNAANPSTTAPAPTEVHPWDNVPLPQTVAAAQPYQAPVAVLTISSPAPWLCPVHNQVKTVPGGVSKSTGQTYNAFLACPVKFADGSYCQQKPPRA
jgi:hypothetical protein